MRHLPIVMITIALASICASAQPPSETRTFTDYANQRLTIDSYGRVVSFKGQKKMLKVLGHRYRICSCGTAVACINSGALRPGATAALTETPSSSEILMPEETLSVEAVITQGDITLIRRIAWTAGSNVALLHTVTRSRNPICGVEENSVVLMGDGCPRPPLAGLTCPPPTESSVQTNSEWVQQSRITTLYFSRPARRR